MVLSSAISNGLTNSLSKTATKSDLRDSDVRIYEGHVHISSKESNFRAWSALPMVHLVTASLSAGNLLTPPTVLASLFRLFSSLINSCLEVPSRLPFAIELRGWSHYHCVVNLCFLSDVHTSCHIWHGCACWWKSKRVRKTPTHTFPHQNCPLTLQYESDATSS